MVYLYVCDEMANDIINQMYKDNRFVRSLSVKGDHVIQNHIKHFSKHSKMLCDVCCLLHSEDATFSFCVAAGEIQC